ncbi:hypothetical protein N8I84_15705 [Streptomyces cynarae]|uniref:Uncharacterized protein n=1 Tax=Streptomyces cynarae TaxID=2981134 RepID=A0ABY6E081_9ACTN|nr:hypothetical protein [Streptomyces cynarae]UXY20002.1 hypothetical protein N8I84_15705 [Streptomyces cynarae]
MHDEQQKHEADGDEEFPTRPQRTPAKGTAPPGAVHDDGSPQSPHNPHAYASFAGSPATRPGYAPPGPPAP